MILSALTTVVAPLLPFLLPGLAGLPRWHKEHPLLLWARIGITSFAFTTLATLGGALLGTRQPYIMAALGLITVSLLIHQRRELTRITQWHRIVAPPVVCAVLLFLFTLPLITVHDGLPTGDIQKSIIWARDILATNHLPSYQRAVADYNRDPVDFYTPGLHTALAYVLSLNNSLATASIFSIAIALTVAGVGGALAQALFPQKSLQWVPWIATGLILTNVRFLRYLREPGYHVQNSVGELLLFGFILCALFLLKRWTWIDATIAAATLLALAFTHQFSMFIAGFALLPIGLAFLINYYRRPRTTIHLALPGLALLAIIVTSVWSGLHKKIPHIFSTTPHLLAQIPTFSEYFSLMGAAWLCLGIAGVILLVARSVRDRKKSLPTLSFIGVILILLFLSQAPRLFIDIPPVRALFYLVVPLSITGAYFLRRTITHTPLLALAAAIGVLISLSSAYTLSHTIRTNSTYLPEQIYLNDFVLSQPQTGGILVDDYNRRSAAWLILSGRPMFTRIAADLERQMAESEQSSLRQDLYLKQLDFEKIFSLGSFSPITVLMNKHNIDWITGITGGSADAFTHNNSLTYAAGAGDTHLFQVITTSGEPAATKSCARTLDASLIAWLLRTSTLANDIGDNEDTFEHLPASVRSARLSDPHYTSGCTYRATNAQYIPLSFNVGDYVAALWQQEAQTEPDITLEAVMRFANPPPNGLTLVTPTGHTHVVPINAAPIRLAANEVPVDDRGFITLLLHNPTNQELRLDLIALGLSRIP